MMFTCYTRYRQYALAILLCGTLFQGCRSGLQNAVEEATPDASQSFVDPATFQIKITKRDDTIEGTTLDVLQSFVDTPALQRSGLRLQRAIERTTPDVSQVPSIVLQEHISPSMLSPLSTNLSGIFSTSASKSPGSQDSATTYFIPRYLFPNTLQASDILLNSSLTDQEAACLLCNLRPLFLERNLISNGSIGSLGASSISPVAYASFSNTHTATTQPAIETSYYARDENAAAHLQETGYTRQCAMLHAAPSSSASDLPASESTAPALEQSIKHELKRLEHTLQAQLSRHQAEICKPMLDYNEKLQQYNQVHQELSSQLRCERMRRQELEKRLDFYKTTYNHHLVTCQKKQTKHQRDYEFILAENDWLKSRLNALEGAQQTILSPKQVFRASAPTMAFGKEEWQHYLGDVDEKAPPLPADIDAILYSKCPFWPNKKVKDTHCLVLIPSKVYGQPFTLNLLEELAKKPSKGGFATRYRLYGKTVKAVLGDKAPSHPYWALVARHILPHSCHRTHEEQSSLIRGYARQTGLDYEQPSILELATAILTHHVRSGERLYTSTTSYARCQECLLNLGPITMGGFSSAGLSIATSIPVSSDGVTARIRFDLCYPDAFDLETPSSSSS